MDVGNPFFITAKIVSSSSKIASNRIILNAFGDFVHFKNVKIKDDSTIKTFDELIDLEYGEIGTESRNAFEKSSTLFIESEMRKEAKREANQHPEQMPTNSLYSIEITPLVKSLSGVATLDKDIDFKKEYANYLADKYK